MQPILLATDGSATAASATAEAIRLARADGAPLVVVTVWDVPTPHPTPRSPCFPISVQCPPLLMSSLQGNGQRLWPARLSGRHERAPSRWRRFSAAALLLMRSAVSPSVARRD